ncbi:putative hexose phosphate transport protein|uniref:MFS transporter family glucose-6-phosphate receptor UhpC n=1 Tax=Neochlamydia sp. AcF84 TaxID=2315858 RepID=UPI001409F08C|nr:putative hexose phosphate transport protein [Neochlamydia sp. AcF84]
MNWLLRLLRPAPYLPEIQDQEKVKHLYNYWRIRILYSMFIGYAFYYFTRKSFTFAMPGIIAELGFDKSQLGILASIFSITYGFSKFASGIISDRSNARYFMAFGLIITGIINILFGLSSNLFLFAIFWGLNGWFQGFGWPPCARFLTHWYSQSERGSWWSTWNVSHNVGAFLIPWIVGFCAYYFGGWRAAMYVPGMICILGGFYLINRLRDTPQSLGLPPIEKFRNDYSGNGSQAEDEQLSAREVLVEYVLKNKYIWMLAISYFFVYFVRTGINDWTALYLIETKGYNQLSANGCVSLFEVGGFFGSLAAGWASDYFFSAKRGPVNVLFAVLMFIAIAFFWFVPAGYPLVDSAAMFTIGFAIFGPQMLIGVACAELSHKKAAASSTGFAGTFAYMGAAVAGYPLGKVTQEMGWDGFFWCLGISCIIAVLLLLPLWAISENKKLVTAKSRS